MDDLAQDIAEAAANVVDVAESLDVGTLDYSEASLAVLEEILEKAAGWEDEMTPEQLQNFAQACGCYVLEVGRREFGGRYCWHEQREQPVLVVGEPDFRVALLAHDAVRGRLSGDRAYNIPFLYAGFAERARRAEPGTDALYV